MHTGLRGVALGVLALVGGLAFCALHGCSSHPSSAEAAPQQPVASGKKLPPPAPPPTFKQDKGPGLVFAGGPGLPPPPVKPADPPRKPDGTPPLQQDNKQPPAHPADPPAPMDDGNLARVDPPEAPGRIGDRLKQPPPTRIENNTITQLGGKNLRQWIVQIKSTDPGESTTAIQVIPLFGSASRDAVPNLIYQAQHAADTSPRVNAIIALRMVEIQDADVPKVVAVLADRLRSDQQSIVRAQAALSLQRFDAKDLKPAIDALAHGVEDRGSWEVRRASIRVLAPAAFDKDKGSDPRALTPLTRVIGRSEPSALVRMEAAQALGILGRPSRETDRALVMQALRNALYYDSHKCVQLWARVSLIGHTEKVDDQDLSAITKLFASTTMEHRVDACRALGVIHPLVKKAKKDDVSLRALTKALSDQQPEVRNAALLAIGVIGRDATSTLPQLKAMVENRDTDEATKELVKTVMEKVSGLPRRENRPPR